MVRTGSHGSALSGRQASIGSPTAADIRGVDVALAEEGSGVDEDGRGDGEMSDDPELSSDGPGVRFVSVCRRISHIQMSLS